MNRISFWSLKYLQFHNMSFHETTEHDYHRTPHSARRALKAGSSPDKLDWRDYGVVGEVHKQGSCNSCWAFAAAGSLEYWLKRSDPDAEVSVQSILDCTPKTYGCMGGLMENVFNYQGDFALGYAYKGKTGKCSRGKGVRAISHVDVEADVEEALAYMIHKWGPVSVAVDFSKQHGYKGGVIRADECTGDPHHAVLAVGYTPEYWIVKNSMGTDWGDKGYAYIQRGVNACGLDTYASVATGVKT